MALSHMVVICITLLLALLQHVQGASCADYANCDSCINNGIISACGWCVDDQTCRSSNTDASCLDYQSPTSRKIDETVNNNSDINPVRVEVKLRVGKPLTVSFDVKVPEGKPIDFFFLFDASGSMSDDMKKIQSISAQFRSLLTGLCDINAGDPNPDCVKMQVANFIDRQQNFIYPDSMDDYKKRVYPFRFGLGYEDGEFKAFLDTPNDSNNFIDAISDTDNNRVILNGDEPEGAFDAIMQAIQCAKWNPDARHLLFVGTDAVSHLEGLSLHPLATQFTSWLPDFFTGQYLVKRCKALGDPGCRKDLSGRWGLLQERNKQTCWIKTFDGDTAENVREAQLREVHSNCMLDDAPSASKLKQAMLANNVIPIFAATNTDNKIWQFWTALQASLGFGGIAVLAEDSENIATLIQSAYSNIQSTVQIEPIDNGYGRVDFIKMIDAPKTVANLGGSVTMTVTLEAKADGTPLSTAWSDVENPPLRLLALGIGEVEIKIGKQTCDCYDTEEILANGVCTCGLCECESVTACPVNPDTGIECSGLGVCTCGTCRCNEATGSACECPSGDGACPVAANGLVCGGPLQGQCECGKCACSADYNGTSCQCAETPPQCNASNCVNGECLPNGDINCPYDICICDGLYTGDTCECAPCASTCAAEKMQGVCVTTGATCGSCECADGYDPATDCQCKISDPTTCPLVDGEECGGHGVCVCGVCECNTGYSGTDCGCSEYTPCDFDDNNQQCGGHGQCVCGQCECEVSETNEPLYADDSCTCAINTICPTFNGLECGGEGFGNCLRESQDCGVCECVDGRAGSSCECIAEDCPLSEDGLVCNGRGSCNECGRCECDEGFGGASCSCEIAANPCDAETTCGGRGTCLFEDDQCGVCTCDENYIGDTCECDVRPCPTVNGQLCGEFGLACEACTRKCICEDGYKQPTSEDGCVCRDDVCGEVVLANGTAQVCSGRGTCGASDCGCTCDEGFAGQDCSECDPGTNFNVTRNVVVGDYCGGVVVQEATAVCVEDVCASWCEAHTDCGDCADDLACGWCGSNNKCYDAARVSSLCADQDRVNEDCNDPVNAGGAIGAAVGAVALLVLLTVALVKGIQMVMDRREWAAHNRALEGMKWNTNANPHFEPQTTETINPFYAGGP
ncbi:hypothetical protein SARC_02360 [Sphaeroforma arctica JP610]|uniref:Integrin beta n=1 Tax=Sphaeroforma arctica JP610 TaxID=667725 RepID=A0A0L0G967_9EUKA|nr:hypothetical protein SARC_02360 [Sphaeroforma arctica JP610]KNC85454.1 hypothetical protein SARC_02360 [Sphaeroforma arctica JP610]|eukprot:XP_014159356.1 hypothetical protein SARC_02360 [Sphaeroforma arctica JP610]